MAFLIIGPLMECGGNPDASGDTALDLPDRRRSEVKNRVGGGVTSAVLPHHRTYGSVYGGSRSPLETEPLIPQRQECTAIKVGFRKSSVHVRSPGIPPGAAPIRRRRPGLSFLQTALPQTFGASEGAFPVAPDNTTQFASYPAIKFVKDAFHLSQPEVVHPAT